ncbi:probable transcription factor At5g28040 [Cicer arietinum]|uniref:Probable transcription factor At5g28040 n=1 Tax=Cicer arietinum TaxID=3827 RepID=A0A1S3E3B2_CICAR|nr:probable transcription factor At5g28040 [Cicer arietinum]
MASFQNAVVLFKQEYIEDELEEEYDEEEDDVVLGEPDEEDDNNNKTEPPPSTSSAITTVILALPNAATTVVDGSPEPKRQHTEEKKSMDDPRKMFQRLWTDEDEIELLQGFLDYNANRGTYHNDTASFYDRIKSKLQLEFNKSQLVEKLRRLKRKYRNAVKKIDSGKEVNFKSPHDQATFEISHKIWNSAAPVGNPVEDDDEINPNTNPNPNSGHTTPVKNEPIIEKKTAQSRKRSRTTASTEEKRELNNSPLLNNDNHNYHKHNHNTNNNNSKNHDVVDGGDKCNGRQNVPGLIEETVKSCLTPVLKELASSSSAMGSPYGFGGRGFGVGGFSMNTMPLGFLNLGSGEKVVDEKWRKQQILELEVYSKRLELVQDEIKVALDELRSSTGTGVRGVSKF